MILRRFRTTASIFGRSQDDYSVFRIRDSKMSTHPIILNESERLSGQTPVYELFGEELGLTIFAAKSLQEEKKS